MYQISEERCLIKKEESFKIMILFKWSNITGRSQLRYILKKILMKFKQTDRYYWDLKVFISKRSLVIN